MAIKNWRDYPVVDFANLPDPVINDQSVYIVRDRGMSAWKAGGGKWTMIEAGNDAALNLGVLAWPDKPLPNSVPVGSMFTCSTYTYTPFYTDGTYWRPVGGVLSITVNCSGISSSSSSLVNLTVPNMPALPIKEWLSTPGASLETRARMMRSSPANTQPTVVHLRPPGTVDNMFFLTITNTNPAVIAYGSMENISPTAFTFAMNLQPFPGSATSAPTDNLTSLPSGLVVPVLSMQAGATDGSETINLHSLNFTLRM